MTSTSSSKWWQPVGASIIFACALSAALFILQRHFGYNLADGGFLWYGVERTLAGEVPLRDFMSYDPGRYWLSALFLAAAHDEGIVTLRIWLAVVEAVGLCLAVLVVARAHLRPRFFDLTCVALMAACWMYPEHKVFDIVLSIAIVVVLSFLIEKPSAKRFFWTGCYVGFSAVIGRNHGVYGGVACVLAFLYLIFAEGAIRPLLPRALFGVLGIAVGYAPMLLALLTVPGLWSSFVQSILLLLNAKETNLPLPVPWPWRVPFAGRASFDIVRETLIGVAFVALPLFALVGTVRVFYRTVELEIKSVFVAAVIAAIPYEHYAFSRADAGHLAHSIFPLAIGLISWPRRPGSDGRWPIFILLAASVVTMAPLMPRVQALRSGDWSTVRVGRDTLVVDPGTAQSVKLLQRLNQIYVGAGQTLLVAPLWPGAYPLLNRTAPTWDIYGLFARSAKFENAEIDRLRGKSVGVVVIQDVALDGRDDLRFKNTHPLMQRYIDRHFEIMHLSGQDPSILVYVPRKDDHGLK